MARDLRQIVETIRKFGMKKELVNPKLVITSKPVLEGNSLSYKEIRVAHGDNNQVLDCLKELHRDFGEDTEFLELIDTTKNIEYVGHIGEFNCKAFL